MKGDPNMMETLSSVMKTLRERGYDIDFNLEPHKSELLTNYKNYRIKKTYRFEGMTNPDDEAILYSIISADGSKKGTLVNGYGITSDETVNHIAEKISYIRK